MGFASYAEDIERRLLEQRTDFDTQIYSIRRWVAQQTPSTTTNLDLIEDIETRVRDYLARIDRLVEETGQKVLAVFDKATARLRDPNVRIVKRLDKVESKVEALRVELADARSKLEKCRHTNTSLNGALVSLKAELATAKRENARLAEKAAWSTEIGAVKPIRRK